MGPMTLETPKDPLSFETFSILWFVIGGVIIYGLQLLKKFSEKKA